MKSDSELQEDVLAELEWEPRINPAGIGVAVKEGVVTLSGEVNNFTEKWAAEEAASRVYGVKGIAVEIDVRLPHVYMHKDEDIARTAANVLSWNTDVPHERIKIKVENGRVTLTGDVDWQYQKLAASNAVRSLMGVMSVENLISVKPGFKPEDIKTDIEDALKRNAVLDAQKVKVDFDKSKGFCEGTYVLEKGCEVTFHSLKHTYDEVAIKNCKKCSCPLARSHRKLYSEQKRGIAA